MAKFSFQSDLFLGLTRSISCNGIHSGVGGVGDRVPTITASIFFVTTFNALYWLKILHCNAVNIITIY